jgi:predicted ABC-type ATPase
MRRHAYVIAGPNGAGKTTFARKFLPRYAHCREFLNADLMAAGISPLSPDTAAMAAGRVLLERMSELVQGGKDFGFETTLAGKTYRPILQDMKDRGYTLHLFYLWLPDVGLALSRVARRVQEGGHDVPEAAIRRRFDLGLHNLFHLYLSLFDSWFVFDNSTTKPRIVARFKEDGLAVRDVELYSHMVQAAGGKTDE